MILFILLPAGEKSNRPNAPSARPANPHAFCHQRDGCQFLGSLQRDYCKPFWVTALNKLFYFITRLA
jgi:hypothetical protein